MTDNVVLFPKGKGEGDTDVIFSVTVRRDGVIVIDVGPDDPFVTLAQFLWAQECLTIVSTAFNDKRKQTVGLK